MHRIFRYTYRSVLAVVDGEACGARRMGEAGKQTVVRVGQFRQIPISRFRPFGADMLLIHIICKIYALFVLHGSCAHFCPMRSV